MNARAVHSPLHLSLRWTARVTSLLLFGIVMLFLFAEGGPPNVFKQIRPVQLELTALGLVMLGFIVGWVREGLGGSMVLLGVAAFQAVELSVNGRVMPFLLFVVIPGILFVLSALLDRQQEARP
jgi:hypothetical protein